MGPHGARGARVPRVPRGARGAHGARGARGAREARGTRGTRGARGARGAKFSGPKTQLSCMDHSGSWERTDYFGSQPLPLGCCFSLQIIPDSLTGPTRKI